MAIFFCLDSHPPVIVTSDQIPRYIPFADAGHPALEVIYPEAATLPIKKTGA